MEEGARKERRSQTRRKWRGLSRQLNYSTPNDDGDDKAAAVAAANATDDDDDIVAGDVG
jgi:hypothetical protein